LAGNASIYILLHIYCCWFVNSWNLSSLIRLATDLWLIANACVCIHLYKGKNSAKNWRLKDFWVQTRVIVVIKKATAKNFVPQRN